MHGIDVHGIDVHDVCAMIVTDVHNVVHSVHCMNVHQCTWGDWYNCVYECAWHACGLLA